MKKTKSFLTVFLFLFIFSSVSYADPLPSGTLLTIDLGECDICTSQDGIFPGTGSAFGAEVSPGFMVWVPIVSGPDGGFILGQVQPASGSHNGPPDGTENPSIDQPWSFFNNTGMHWSNLPIEDLGGGMIDMTGWQLTWNGIPQLWDYDPCFMRQDDLLGDLVVDLTTQRYTLDYDALRLENCWSLYSYYLHLEGTIQLPPAIKGFWPGSGSAWDFVFVFGSDFVENETEVTVNGIPAMGVYVLDSDVLIFMVPDGDTSGPITVTTPSGSAASVTDFGVPLTGLQITGVWPGQGSPWDFVFVFGAGFVEDETSVQLNGVDAMGVVVLDESVLIFMVPYGAATGPITVTTPSGSVTSAEDFVVLP